VHTDNGKKERHFTLKGTKALFGQCASARKIIQGFIFRRGHSMSS